jgi:hypothetical protein
MGGARFTNVVCDEARTGQLAAPASEEVDESSSACSPGAGVVASGVCCSSPEPLDPPAPPRPPDPPLLPLELELPPPVSPGLDEAEQLARG